MEHKLTYTFLFIICSLIFSCTEKQEISTINSPNGKYAIQLKNEEGRISYQLTKGTQVLIHQSELSILPDVKSIILSAKKSSNDETWKPIWGQFSEVRDHYNELLIKIKLDGVDAKLYARIYNEGIGFRYELEGYEEGAKAIFYCEYNLDDKDALYGPAGEKAPFGPFLVEDLKSNAQKSPKIRMPLLIENSEKPYLSILETDLVSAPGFELINLTFDSINGFLLASNEIALTGEKMITPWRVILMEDKIGDLVTSTVALNLAAPCQIADPSWIKPGKTLWDWRVHGYTTEDGFTYGIDTESYFRFIDFAAKKGIKYFLIDDAWYKKVTPGQFELSDKLDLKKVLDYANEKGIDILLYYDRRHGEYGDEALFEYYSQSLGVKGIKYGFMNTNVAFTRNAIAESAKHHLLIDFHDGPVPITGIQRTFPNAVTREFCHAQQDSRKAFTPETFIKMALINAIQGTLDMNNGNFDLTGINEGKREKGPKKLNSYLSTVVSETARTLIVFSGLVCIPDAPEAYAEKSDLFEFIQKLPVGKWDESIVLYAKINEYITTARRQGEEWYIGSVYNQEGGDLDLILDFLKEGLTYTVTYYEDTEETHCKTNPEAYQIRTGQVKKGDIVKAKMAPGGGHCMWIRPA